MSVELSASVKLCVPAALRGFVGDQSSVAVEGGTVSEALDFLVEKHPSLRNHLFDDTGTLRSFVNVYRNDDDIRYIDGLETSLSSGDTISIIPSIAGGLEA